jgi:hypothetical protein
MIIPLKLAYTYKFPCAYPSLGANTSHLHITMSMDDCPVKVSYPIPNYAIMQPP